MSGGLKRTDGKGEKKEESKGGEMDRRGEAAPPSTHSNFSGSAAKVSSSSSSALCYASWTLVRTGALIDL